MILASEYQNDGKSNKKIIIDETFLFDGGGHGSFLIILIKKKGNPFTTSLDSTGEGAGFPCPRSADQLMVKAAAVWHLRAAMGSSN